MNGKKAKMIRREAQKRTVGKPLKNYRAENTINRINEHGDTVFQTSTMVLHDCTRSMYQAFKKAYKKGLVK